MTGNQVVSTMFDVNTSIHMARIISLGDCNEYLEWLGSHLLNSYPQVAMEYYLNSWHGSTLYDWWLFPVLSLDNMDLLCMFRSHVLLSTLLIIDLQCTFGSHDIVIFMDLQCIGPQPWLSQKNKLLVLWELWSRLSLPLILDWYLTKCFTYHIFLASYFGGNYIAPKKSTDAWAPFKALAQGFFWMFFPTLE